VSEIIAKVCFGPFKKLSWKDLYTADYAFEI